MTEFIGSLSLVSGAVLVSALSALITVSLLAARQRGSAWAAGIATPIVAAYVLYWFPVWKLGHSAAEYSVWELLVVGAWSAAGVTVSGSLIGLHELVRWAREHAAPH